MLNTYNVAESSAVEPMYYGSIVTIHKCSDYQGVLIIQSGLHAKAPFVTITMCVNYAGAQVSTLTSFTVYMWS